MYQHGCEVLDEWTRWGLVLVDEGSPDGSTGVTKGLYRDDPRVRCVFFARSCGQTSSMRAGIERGRAVHGAAHADMQNDPTDLPKMLRLFGDADAVVGWRMKRNDDFGRRASSKIANAIHNKLSHDQIRDTGCSLELFRTAAIRQVPLHVEGMHRFMPTLMRYLGFKVLEHPVSHHLRRAGVSKYAVANRALRALRDLLAARWMRTRIRRLPIVVGEADLSHC